MTPQKSERLAIAAEQCGKVQWLESFRYIERFFERLPFEVSPLHVKYAGRYARLICELGRSQELLFYRNLLENAYDRTLSSDIGYLLCIFGHYLEKSVNGGVSNYRFVLDRILRDGQAPHLHFGAKILLANSYLRLDEPTVSKFIIEHTNEPKELSDRLCFHTWRAIILRNDKKYGDSTELLRAVSERAGSTNWYLYFYAQLYRAMNYRDMKEFAEMRRIVQHLRDHFQGLRFRRVSEDIKKNVFSHGHSIPTRFQI